MGGVSLATAYHNARDILPHNPVRKVYYHEGGTVFFYPRLDSYGPLKPEPSSLVRDRDVLSDLCEAAAARSMTVSAWTVYLHNSRLAKAHPEQAPRNAFGDRSLTDLCPADPAVRRYAVALTKDICRYPVSSIMAEALHFKTLEHGYHHERYFIDLGPTARFLLGLCFCESCLAAAQRDGVDSEGVRKHVERYLSDVFNDGGGGHEPLDPTELGEAARGQMAGYLRARSGSVTSLLNDVVGVAAESGTTLTYSAHGGSAKGGDTKSSDKATDAWVLGVDLPSVAVAVEDFEILGYVAEDVDLAPYIEQYQTAIGSTGWSVGLRPMYPDTTNAATLTERVQLVRRLGARRVDFYHYGLMPSRSLDWINAALTA